MWQGTGLLHFQELCNDITVSVPLCGTSLFLKERTSQSSETLWSWVVCERAWGLMAELKNEIIAVANRIFKQL